MSPIVAMNLSKRTAQPSRMFSASSPGSSPSMMTSSASSSTESVPVPSISSPEHPAAQHSIENPNNPSVVRLYMANPSTGSVVVGPDVVHLQRMPRQLAGSTTVPAERLLGVETSDGR